MRWIFPLVCAFAVTASLGCEDKSPSPSAETPTVDLGPACTNDATVEAIYSLNRGIPGRSIPAYDELECRLSRGLIQPSDLGPDWAVHRSDAWPGEHRGVGDCYLVIPAIVSFVRDEITPGGDWGWGVHSRVALLRPGAAENLFEAFEKNCALDRKEERRTWARLPGLGDDAIIVNTWVTDFTGAPDIESVHVRIGNVISSTSIVMADEVGVDVAALQRLATERLIDLPALPEPTPSAGAGCSADRADDAPNDEELELGLLTLDDLPQGWVENVPGECGFVSTGFFCESEVTFPEADRSAYRSFITSSSVATRGFAQYVEHFQDGDAGEYMRLITEVNSGGRECAASYDGEAFRWHMEPLSPPNTEEAVQAWGMRSIGGGVDASYCIAHIASGDVVTTLVYVPSTFSDLEPDFAYCDEEFFYDFFDVVQAASEKMHAVDD